MWVGENESAKFWAAVLNGLRNRGVEDIFIACTDNLAGFSGTIEAVFPKAEIRNCVIRQIRNSTKYVSYKDLKALMADLKAVYAAVDEALRSGSPGCFLRTLGQEVPQDFRLLAGKLAEPEHLFQVPSGGTAADLHHQRH
jgi:transposase-like protein